MIHVGRLVLSIIGHLHNYILAFSRLICSNSLPRRPFIEGHYGQRFMTIIKILMKQKEGDLHETEAATSRLLSKAGGNSGD